MTAYDRLLEINEETSSRLRNEGQKMWEESPFGWLLSSPPARKGRVGTEYVWSLLEREGLNVTKHEGRPVNTLDIGEKQIKVKMSLLWAGDVFCFQQLAPLDSWTHCAMLALAPSASWLWLAPRKQVLGRATYQHGKDTKWLSFKASDLPKWLVTFGGELSDPETMSRVKAGLQNVESPDPILPSFPFAAEILLQGTARKPASFPSVEEESETDSFQPTLVG